MRAQGKSKIERYLTDKTKTLGFIHTNTSEIDRRISPIQRLKREMEDTRKQAVASCATATATAEDDAIVHVWSRSLEESGDCGGHPDVESKEFEYELEYDDDDSDPGVHTQQQDTNGDEYVGLFNVDPVTCPICFSRADSGTALTLPKCGHSFCLDCFQQCIQMQVEQGQANDIHCPSMQDSQCGQPVGQSVLEEILDAEILARLMRLSVSAMTLSNPDYHHCPTPDCPNVVLWKKGNGPPIGDCFKCGRQSCLQCGVSPYHTGWTCESWEQRVVVNTTLSRRYYVDCSRAGEELRYDYDQTTDASLADLNIRMCRRCGSGVELASGCLKMKCRCGYRFCFQCGSENAQCGCTPAHHGFADNITGKADFTGLHQAESTT